MAPQVIELTAAGVGAVSVLEVRGEGALEALRALVGAQDLELGVVRLVRIRDAGEDLDEALCLVLDAQRVELHLHGSPVLVERVARALGGRAGPQSTLESLEEEARRLLQGARSETGARILLDQAEGALTRRLRELEAMEDAEEAQAGLAELVRISEASAHALLPPRIVLAGSTNAGKSTLFNALVGEERAITSAEAGTTRDWVIAPACMGGIECEVVDTAGERELTVMTGAGAVEAAGQRAARSLRERSDVVFWLERADGVVGSVPAGCEVLVTHADRVLEAPAGAVSALADPKGARAVVGARVVARLGVEEPVWEPGRGVLFTEVLRKRAIGGGAGACLSPAPPPFLSFRS